MVAEIFALLAALGYVAPWARDGSDQVAELAAASWRAAFDGRSRPEVIAAVQAWVAADERGFWPKPGQVRAYLPPAAPPAVLLLEADELAPDDRAIADACARPATRAALWQGDPPAARWPGGSMAAAARRLVGARMLLERVAVEHPVPESSHAQVLIDAVVDGGLYDPATSLADLRAWLVERIARDPERVVLMDKRRRALGAR